MLAQEKEFNKKAAENLKVAKTIENHNQEVVTVNHEDYQRVTEEKRRIKEKELELERLKLEENKRLQEEEKQREKEQKQKKLIQDTKLVFLTADYAILKNRTVIRIGDSLNFEPYLNRVVIDFDFENRRVYLDDKTYITFN